MSDENNIPVVDETPTPNPVPVNDESTATPIIENPIGEDSTSESLSE